MQMLPNGVSLRYQIVFHSLLTRMTHCQVSVFMIIRNNVNVLRELARVVLHSRV